jgi:hypothetical protein
MLMGKPATGLNILRETIMGRLTMLLKYIEQMEI